MNQYDRAFDSIEHPDGFEQEADAVTDALLTALDDTGKTIGGTEQGLNQFVYTVVCSDVDSALDKLNEEHEVCPNCLPEKTSAAFDEAAGRLLCALFDAGCEYLPPA